jgi:hypothetical protein
MKPPRVLKFHRFKKLFKRYGVEVVPGKEHFRLQSPDGRKYPIPPHKDSDEIEKVYTETARRHFSLTPDDGISDQEFYQVK